MLRLEPRREPSAAMVYGAPVLAIALTLIAGSLLFAALGHNPAKALRVFFVEPLSSAYGLAELCLKATPLALCAIGLAIGFRAGVWNIGAEGQLVVGAIAGGGVALLFPNGGSAWLVVLAGLAGALGGLAWASVPAWLRTRFNANEILTSLMLTYVAGLLLQYLVIGPWKDPMGFNFPQSKTFHGDLMLPKLIEGQRLNAGAVIALLAIIGGWIMLSRSLLGFQVRVIGLAPAAGIYAGFVPRRMVWFTLLLSGALAGLAGAFEVTGPIGQLLPSISPGYGFTAIIVAFLGRLHPIGILAASLLIALTYLGGEAAQIMLRLPIAATGVFQGMLLFFLLACDVLIRYRIRFGTLGRKGALS